MTKHRLIQSIDTRTTQSYGTLIFSYIPFHNYIIFNLLPNAIQNEIETHATSEIEMHFASFVNIYIRSAA